MADFLAIQILQIAPAIFVLDDLAFFGFAFGSFEYRQVFQVEPIAGRVRDIRFAVLIRVERFRQRPTRSFVFARLCAFTPQAFGRCEERSLALLTEVQNVYGSEWLFRNPGKSPPGLGPVTPED